MRFGHQKDWSISRPSRPKGPVFDCAVIGSGPASLIEAIAQAALDRRVVVLEAQDRLGGAWSHLELFGFNGVENAAHVLHCHPDCYRLLEETIGVSMTPLLPPPMAVSFRNSLHPRCVPFGSWRWKCQTVADDLAHYGPPRTLSAVGGGICLPLMKAGVLAVRTFKRGGLVHRYPTGGTAGLIQTLERSLAERGVEIRRSVRVTRVKVDSTRGAVELQTSAGPVTTTQLVLTTQSNLPCIEIAGRETLAPIRQHHSVQLHILVGDSSPIAFSYLHFGLNPLMRRASDITRYVHGYREDQRDFKIFAATLRSGVTPDENGAKLVLNVLRDLRVIGDDAELRDCSWSTCRFAGRSAPALRTLKEALGRRLTVLRAEDLSSALAVNGPRWRAAISTEPESRFRLAA